MIEPSSTKPAIGIVVTHGNLAEELCHTTELIVGKLSGCYAISGSEVCDEDLIAKIRAIIDREQNRNTIVFVDYFGGSCCLNSMRAVRGLQGVKVISGVNLPVLLDFVTKRNLFGFQEMVNHLINRGKESVRLVEL
jgi:PTS system mannose-specific IIA component